MSCTRRQRLPPRFSTLILLACVLRVAVGDAAVAAPQFCDLKADEQIIFCPATASLSADGTYWEAEVRGWVFEPERRAAALALVDRGLRLNGIEISADEQKVLNHRLRLFLVDAERGKRILITTPAGIADLGKSAADGTFFGCVRLPAPVPGGRQTNKVLFEALLAPGDSRRFSGEIRLVESTGFTVISDIDDTIKVTCVRDRKAMLRNSLLLPFRSVPGMAKLFSSCAAIPGIEFVYVSASPWQFFSPLAEFVNSNGFPAGSCCLKRVGLNHRTFSGLLQDPKNYKIRTIEPLLLKFPQRRFVLVGDSGEGDPEAYADLARRYPRQICRILIRDVTEEPADSPRYQNAFKDLPPGLWQVFNQPPASLLPIPKRPAT